MTEEPHVDQHPPSRLAGAPGSEGPGNGAPGSGAAVGEGPGSRTRAVKPRVVLGVSGGIAAYKAVEVCRLLVDAGVHVIPVMTSEATRFVGKATFSALASEPV